MNERIDVGHVEIDVDVVDNPPGPPTKVLRMSAHVSACQSQWINTIFKGSKNRGAAAKLRPLCFWARACARTFTYGVLCIRFVYREPLGGPLYPFRVSVSCIVYPEP